MFIQPFILWALPLILVPVIIHLLNRLRYRSVKWAAMIFLLSATKSSTRRAKLKQFLILLFRVLAVLAFILALSRPLVGGWMGWTFAGVPDTIIILLDRSASMEDQDPTSQVSKRERALGLLKSAADEFSGASHMVLIENVRREAVPLPSPDQLEDFALVQPTDTAADIPAMLQEAMNYIIDNNSGRTEIWIASDLQESSWKADSVRWESLAAGMEALPQDVTIRLLSMTGSQGLNRSLQLREVNRRKQGDAQLINMDLAINRLETISEKIPVTYEVDGGRSQSDVQLEGQQLEFDHRFPVEADRKQGWGKVEIPPDHNNRDNRVFFAYREDLHLKSAVVSGHPLAGPFLTLAAAPAPEQLNQSSSLIKQTSSPAIPWNDISLLIWQAAMPDSDTAASMSRFINEGGVVIMFPPASQANGEFMGLSWGDITEAPAGKPFKIAQWDDRSGLLANTENGQALPLAELECKRFQAILDKGEGKEEATVIAQFADSRPFMVQKHDGDGSIFLVSSLPDPEWSDLINGTVLVPMLQRALYQGGSRLSQVSLAWCGEWAPEDDRSTWISLDADKNEFKDPRWHAGVYRAGSQTIALNTPPAEFETTTLSEEAARPLFGRIPVQTLEARHEHTGDLQSEIWRILLLAALISMVVEGFLILPPKSASPYYAGGRT
jgi:hypothetical protein